MKKFKYFLLIGLGILLFSIGLKSVGPKKLYAENLDDETIEKYLEIINNNDSIKLIVYNAMTYSEYEYSYYSSIGYDNIPPSEKITLEELKNYIGNEEKIFSNIPLFGSWNFEYYSSELEIMSYDENYKLEEFNNLKHYTFRKIDDWSWMSLFKDKNITLTFNHFTETDYLSLQNSGFYQELSGKAYSINATGFARVLGFDFSKIWPIDLIREDRRNETNLISATSFGGRIPVIIDDESYDKISVNVSEYTFVDPNGDEKPLYRIDQGSVQSIVFLDNGTYLYFQSYYMDKEPEDNYTNSYYNKNTSANIIARYDLEYGTVINEEGIEVFASYYKLNDKIPVGVNTETGVEIEEDNNISIELLKEQKEYKFGGPRNIYSPLMYTASYTDYENPEIWNFSSSYWNAVFQFNPYVTVKYIDTEGNELAPNIVIEGEIGDNYETEEKSFTDYTLEKVEGNKSGTFKNADPLEVTYIYININPYVTVKYIDTEENELAPNIVIEGKVGDNYETEEKSFTDYTLEKVEGNKSGTFKNTDPLEVTYIYKNINPYVTVKYINTEGNELAPNVIIEGKVGDNYETEEKSFTDYTLEKVEGNKSGTFKNTDPLAVTYIYKAEGNGLEEENNNSGSNNGSGNGSIGEAKPGINENSNLPIEVTVIVKDNKGNIIFNNVINSKNGEEIIIKAPIINGYTLADKESKKIIASSENKTVEFYYRREAKLLTNEHVEYISGYPDGSIKPENEITRAEVASMLFTLVADSNKNIEILSEYNDVNNNTWYSQGINYLNSKGIIKGYPDGNYKPNEAITRSEFISLISRFFELEESSNNPFSDVNEESWAYNYILSGYAEGWVSGYPDGTYRPNANITRAEAIKTMNTALGRKIQKEDVPMNIIQYSDLNETHWAHTHIIEASNSHDQTWKDNGYELWGK